MAGRITHSEFQLRPDPRYGDRTLSKFINCVMFDGKKSVAVRVVYDALDEMQRRIDKLDKETAETMPKTAIELFHLALNNVKPEVEVRSKRVGGANYQVPMQLNKRRQQSLTFRWIIDAARSEKGKPMHLRLAKELMDAAKREGKAMSTREQTHRMAEANKAFAHFAW
ncbi:MAG: 30S ribosomal protein S7 [Phycisphaerales bacterium]|nr:30S ribosomal protein S7 [Phycisphaerales bacterium]